MTPPDEVRAAFELHMRSEHNLSALELTRMHHRPYPYANIEVQRDWDTYQSAYASGSAARKERDVGIVRGIDVSIYGHMDARAAIEEAIERINKE